MRLLIHVEGQTEEVFVREVLAPYLANHGYLQVSARLLGNARLRLNRGGIRSWAECRRDIVNHLQSDTASVAAVMVDYYGLPAGEGAGWPGRAEAPTRPIAARAACVEAALVTDVVKQMGTGFNPVRFVPLVLMHEFEALLFSDCMRFAAGIGVPNLEPPLQQIRDAFPTPEHINDSPLTAPSRRICALIPTYQKTLHGPLAAIEIGVARMAGECHGFGDWLMRLSNASAELGT